DQSGVDIHIIFHIPVGNGVSADFYHDSVSSVQPAFLMVAKHRIYKCGLHDLCLKIFRWLCIRHKFYNSVHAFS
ncbi:hypothetical protein, partial [Enterocloster lavalensis]|uniref:hypothetical protein n=1 Tax=Enterocloster lavalensis TaxID=460384 RepID=UPI0034A474E8